MTPLLLAEHAEKAAWAKGSHGYKLQGSLGLCLLLCIQMTFSPS